MFLLVETSRLSRDLGLLSVLLVSETRRTTITLRAMELCHLENDSQILLQDFYDNI